MAVGKLRVQMDSTMRIVPVTGQSAIESVHDGNGSLLERVRQLWSRCRQMDSPWPVGFVAGAAGALFALLRLAVAAQGSIGSFITAGRYYVNPSRVPSGVPVGPGSGYDGEFYYRMALDPLNFAKVAFGIRLDTVFRLGRIGYPALAWLVAGGQHGLVPTSLVVVNVIALAALGFAGALLARDAGRGAWWGLVFPGYWGYLWTVGRDLTGLVTAALLIFGLVAYRKERPVLAAVLLTGAVLSKETAFVAVAVLGLSSVAYMVTDRARRRLMLSDMAWIVPGAVYLGWQLLVAASTGKLPLLASAKDNIGIPFDGLLSGIGRYVTGLPSTVSLLWLGELAMLLAVTVAASFVVRHNTVPRHERWAWFAFILEALLATTPIWEGAVGFRSLDDLYLFGWILLLGRKSPLPEPLDVDHIAAVVIVGNGGDGVRAAAEVSEGSAFSSLVSLSSRATVRHLLAGLVGVAWAVVAVQLVVFR